MILVAGGTGRLGLLVVADLVASGGRVRVLTRDPHRAATLFGPTVEVVAGDVRDVRSVRAAVAGTAVVVAAVHGFVGPRGVSPATVDRDGNAHLIDAAAEAGAEVVLMSVVGAGADNPMELFRMKHAAELHLLASTAVGTVVRATAYAELWIELLRETARNGRPLVFGEGENPINFVSVRDVAALVHRVIDDPASGGRALEIGGPENLTFNQLAGLVQAADGGTGSPRHLPRAMLRLVAHTVGVVKPAVGRQVRAALAMDSATFTFDGGDARDCYPDLPCTSVDELLLSS